MTKIDTTCESIKLRLIANAVGLQQCTQTASNIIPLPGGDRVIAIGTAAEVARLLEIAPASRDDVLEEAALAAEKVQDDYSERQGGKWPELRDDAATGAGDCATAIRAKKSNRAASTDGEASHG